MTDFDLGIIGSGPAGLSAAIYGVTEGFSTLVYEKSVIGGQAHYSTHIENVIGFPNGFTGKNYSAWGYAQARKFGAEFHHAAASELTILSDGMKQIRSDKNDLHTFKALILANGAEFNRLTIPGESLAGVCYGQTPNVPDGENVVIVGGANSAGQAAMFMSRTARSVKILIRSHLNMSAYLLNRIVKTPNIEIITGAVAVSAEGDDKLHKISYSVNGKIVEIEACALCVFIGATPRTDWFRDLIETEATGHIRTGFDVRSFRSDSRLISPLETNIPGIFAAGDCRLGSIARVATAQGEGAAAVTGVHKII